MTVLSKYKEREYCLCATFSDIETKLLLEFARSRINDDEEVLIDYAIQKIVKSYFNLEEENGN